MRSNMMQALVAIMLAAIIAMAWMEIRHGISARENPTAVETIIARTMRRLAIPSAAARLKNPFTPNPEALTDSRHHFADHCATCHGNDGSVNTTIGRNLYPKSPDMRLSATQSLTDGELYYIVQNGVRLTGMPAWGQAGEGANDEDSWRLVLFIRHLPKLTTEEEKDMEQYNPESAAERAEEQEEEEFLKGGNPLTVPAQHHH